MYRHDPVKPNQEKDSFSWLFNKEGPEPNSIIMGRPFLCPIGENYDRLCFNESQLRYDDFDNKIFMMTSGYMPLNHLVQHQSEAAIIFDINPIQILFWELTLDYIKNHQTPAAFFEALKQTGQKDYEDRVSNWLRKQCPDWLKSFQYSDGISHSIECLFKRSYGASWSQNNTIVNQENYDYLRQLVLYNAIAVIALDAYDTDALKVIRDTLDNNEFTKIKIDNGSIAKSSKHDGVHISAQYLSNIFEHRLMFNFFSNQPFLCQKTNGLTQLWDQREKTPYEMISAGHAWNNMVGEQGCYRISGMEPALRYIDPALF